MFERSHVSGYDTVGFIPHRCKGCWLLAIFGDSGSLRPDGPSQAEESHLENPGKSTAQRATSVPSAGPFPGIHQKRPRARMLWRALQG
jgi:hypothetical protein